VIILNRADYRQAWSTSDIRADTALKVQTSAQRASQADDLAWQGLSRMGQITFLLIAAAVLALAAAMGAGIWQRRASFAAKRSEGFSPLQLRQMLIVESVLVLGTGAIVGAIAAAYGHLLSDRFLRQTTGFPAPFTIEGIHSIETILIVIIGALVVLAIPGYKASVVSQRWRYRSNTTDSGAVDDSAGSYQHAQV
jgi:putative ABC transport system permease protein